MVAISVHPSASSLRTQRIAFVFSIRLHQVITLEYFMSEITQLLWRLFRKLPVKTIWSNKFHLPLYFNVPSPPASVFHQGLYKSFFFTSFISRFAPKASAILLSIGSSFMSPMITILIFESRRCSESFSARTCIPARSRAGDSAPRDYQ